MNGGTSERRPRRYDADWKQVEVGEARDTGSLELQLERRARPRGSRGRGTRSMLGARQQTRHEEAAGRAVSEVRVNGGQGGTTRSGSRWR